MSNALIEKDDLLSQIDFTYLLKSLNRYIGKLRLEKSKKASIHITNLDQIIELVVEEICKNKSVYDVLNIDKDKNIDLVSINHICKDKFRESVELVYRSLIAEIKENFREFNFPSLDSYRIQDGFKYREDFGLDYDFNKSTIPIGELNAKKTSGAIETRELRVDKAIVKIPVKEISNRIEEGLRNYLQGKIYDEEELEERIEDMYSGDRGVDELKRALSSELNSRIKRSISIAYMEYLLQSVAEGMARQLIARYIDRIRVIESYLLKLSERADSEATITIEGKSYNVLNMFSRGDAFEALPLVGVVDGNIGETSSSDMKCFEFGIRLKLNGRCSRGSKTSYSHGLSCIASEDESYYKKLKYLFLYIFILFEFEKTGEGISERWERARDRINRDGKDGFKAVASFLIGSLKDSKVEHYLNVMREAMIGALSKSSEEFKSLKLDRHIILYRGILSEDPESNNFFKGMKNPKEYLSYVSIEPESRDQGCLLSVPIEIEFDAKPLYLDEKRESTRSITMDYDTSNLNSIPVVFYSSPRSSKIIQGQESLNALKSRIKDFVSQVNGDMDRNSVYIAYKGSTGCFQENTEKTYLYNLLYSIASYMIIKAIIRTKELSDEKEVMVNIIRLHYRDEKEAAEYIRGLSKVLEHMINIDCRSSSQGINIFERFDRNKSRNALKSLYGRVPKKFTGTEHFASDKLAIVIVSSRKSDRVWQGKNHLNTIYGEVVKVSRLDGKSIICDTSATFVENYTEAEVFTEPSVLRDTMKALYDQGYKNIVYIAKAPYTSNLNITNESESLYFMEEELLRYIRGDRSDQNIYPLYYDHFYSTSTGKARVKPQSYYIRDIGAISDIGDIGEQKDRSVEGLFGFYSGLGVKGLYRSIIVYSVLRNSYRDELLERNIGELLEGGEKAKSVLSALKMYHATTFEKVERHSRIKINPYEKLMGTNGLGYHCVEEYDGKLRRGFKTNKLSLMADIRRVIDKESFDDCK